jgi:hypothetical protein
MDHRLAESMLRLPGSLRAASRSPGSADPDGGASANCEEVRMEKKSAEAVCGLLDRSHLLTPDQVRHLFQTWRDQAGSATEGASFCQWLVSRNYLTAFQADLVQRGKVDHFFFGPYKLLERVGKGRMAGVYLNCCGESVGGGAFDRKLTPDELLPFIL